MIQAFPDLKTTKLSLQCEILPDFPELMAKIYEFDKNIKNAHRYKDRVSISNQSIIFIPTAGVVNIQTQWNQCRIKKLHEQQLDGHRGIVRCYSVVQLVRSQPSDNLSDQDVDDRDRYSYRV